MTADLHIVVTRETIILVRRADATFRDFQNRYLGFMTSIGPLDRDGVLDTFENEWPDILVINKNRIGAFLSSDTIPSETTLYRSERDRHTDVALRIKGAIEKRIFAEWAMRHDPAQS